MNLVLIARKVELLNQIAKEIRTKYGVQVEVIIADLCTVTFWQRDDFLIWTLIKIHDYTVYIWSDGKIILHIEIITLFVLHFLLK